MVEDKLTVRLFIEYAIAFGEAFVHPFDNDNVHPIIRRVQLLIPFIFMIGGIAGILFLNYLLILSADNVIDGDLQIHVFLTVSVFITLITIIIVLLVVGILKGLFRRDHNVSR